MIYGHKLIIILLLLLGASACTDSELAAPSCRVNANEISSHQGPAACIIVLSNKLLVLELQSGLYDLAIGDINNTSISHTAMRSAQCVAHEAMWQQTGFNVEVQGVLGAQIDGTWLFACISNSGYDGTEDPFYAPNWSNKKIKSLAFVDPFEIELQNWARRDHFNVVRDAYMLQRTNRAED